MKRKMKSIKKSGGKKYRLQLPAETSNLDMVRQFITEIARNMGFSEEDVFNIELAVDEAATNVIQHAYQKNEKEDRIVDVIVQSCPDRLEVVIGDRGVGFDPSKVQQYDIREYLTKLKRGGLGLFIIQKLMDEVSFRIQPGKRNEVRMVKYLKAGA